MMSSIHQGRVFPFSKSVFPFNDAGNRHHHDCEDCYCFHCCTAVAVVAVAAAVAAACAVEAEAEASCAWVPERERE